MKLTPEDRFAIQDLYVKYCMTVDRNDAEGWAATFTPDGKRVYDDNPGAPGRVGRTVAGRKELIKLQSAHPLSQVRHWQSLALLSDKGDHVEGVAYGTVVDLSQDPPLIIAHFTCTDELVKLEDGTWKIRSRLSVRDLITEF